MKPYPETHQHGSINIENIPNQVIGCSTYIEGELGIQIAKDGRVWVCINGKAFIRFKPMEKLSGEEIAKRLGLRYDGIQEEIGMQFTDIKGTGTTFYANSFTEALNNLAAKRQLFKQ